MTTAIILAGGYGKRLRPLTDRTPKPLLNVGSKPIAVWQMELMKRYGVKRFVLCVGYKREMFREVIGDGSSLGVQVFYAEEKEPLGTGGAIKNAGEYVREEDYFFVLNGDILTNIDPRPLAGKLMDEDAWAAIALVRLPSPYGIVEVDENGLVKRFVEKPALPYWINAGIYCFKPPVLELLPDKGDIERTTLPLLAEKGRLVAVTYERVFWRSIDTHKDLEKAQKEVAILEKAIRD